MGAALLRLKEGTLHPVAYHSAKLDLHQRHYSTIEKELLAIISAIKKFECYLSPSPAPLKVFTDHNPLTFLDQNIFSIQRLLKWSLYLQPFNLQLHHIKGSDNVIADALSRPPSPSRHHHFPEVSSLGGRCNDPRADALKGHSRCLSNNTTPSPSY